ncbi:MAG: Crp/Fnr family transcriptional regulator [Chloroflexi bacterium]|nr:MAG: Crp/Fnr family transcriptional regulator [Chloroflexota bacterium]
MATTTSSPQSRGEYLQHVRLFQGLGPRDLADIIQAARRREIERDAFFFHQGDQATTLYVLSQGRVRLTQVTAEGHQVILHILGPGEMFGGVATLGNTLYPASAQAVEASSALAWDGNTMARLMERYPRIALNALHLLAGRLRELQDRYRELATERVERRVAHALLRLAHQTGRKVEAGVLIDFPLSREDLAEMTGTTLYTVSRILSGWEKQGLIETGRQRVLIRVPHSLVAIAEDLAPGDSPDTL